MDLLQDKKKLIFPGALIFLTLAVFLYNPRPKVAGVSPRLPVVENASPVYKQEMGGGVAESTYLEIESALVKNIQIQRDPFSRSSARAEDSENPVASSATGGGAVRSAGGARPALSLQGVWDEEGQRMAFINNKIVKIGDVVSGYTVKSIEAKQVTVEKYGDQMVLMLGR